MLCETFCNDNILDSYLKVPGFEIVVRKDGKSTNGGRTRGLLMYAREGLKASRKFIKGEDECTEFAALSIPWGEGSHLTLALAYRPPAPPGSMADNGNSARLLNTLANLEGQVVIAGDFNFPNIDWERSWSDSEGEVEFLNLIGDKFWTQLVRGPTQQSGNTLDLVIPSSEELIAEVETLDPLGSSDHSMLEITLVGPAKDRSSKEPVPDWGKANYEAMGQTLQAVDWEELFEGKDGKECMNLFYEQLHAASSAHIPMKLRRTRSRPAWMTKSIMRIVRKKKICWRAYQDHQQDRKKLEEYKDLQSQVKKAVRRAKRKFEQKLARDSKENPKAMWSYLKQNRSNRVSVGPLKDGDRLVTDDKEMAELLNSAFCSFFTAEDTTNLPEAEHPFQGQPLTSVTFSMEKVRKKLRKLKPSAAPGPDKVWTRILHKFADVLAAPLAETYTRLMREVEVPNIWLRANVAAGFKKGSKADPSNYRPISLTCVVGKVMESVAKDEIVDHMARHKLIRLSQHGFMRKRSTATNMLEYMEFLTKKLDEGHSVDCVYWDFAKMFDKIPHQRLLAKCRGLGLGGALLGWIEKWLSGRKQRVVLNGEESGWGDVVSSVVQGSVLGPILAVIFVNDIDVTVMEEEVGEEAILEKFADDTKQARVVDTPEQRAALQRSIQRMEEWCQTWQMELNRSKCHVLHIGYRNTQQQYQSGGDILECVQSEKDVGVMVSSTLKPSLQCAKAAKKANQVLGQVTRGFTYRDEKTFLQLYRSLVLPHLEYIVACWAPYTKADKDILEAVQKRAMRMCTSLKGTTYEEKLRETGMLTLEEKRRRLDLALVYQILTDKLAVDYRTWFLLSTETREEGRRNTRQGAGHLNIVPQKTNLEIRKYSFAVRVCSDWNSLPDSVKMAASTTSFKRRLGDWLDREENAAS